MLMNRHMGLIDAFHKAGLEIEISDKPIVSRANDDIIQMDIRRVLKGNSRREIFRIYMGADGNEVQVRNTDKDLNQVVLYLREPERNVEISVPSFDVTRTYRQHGDDRAAVLNEALPDRRQQARVVEYNPKKGIIRYTQKTPKGARYFLAGRDERQMFMAQLPRACTTVKEAHASLKNPTVTLAEGRAEGRTVRQGEWFFVNPTKEELESIEAAIKKNHIVIEKKLAIGAMNPWRRQGGGKPHTADEIISLPGRLLPHGHAVREREIYVRGKVSHADHKTVSFSSWRKVIRNAEGGAGAGIAPIGVGWID